MTAVPLSPARALRRPRRIDLRGVFGLFLLFVATAGSIAFWSATSDTRGVLVATRDLPTGATLSAGDLAVANVRIDDALYRETIPAEELQSVVGRQLAAPAHASQLLARVQLSSQPLLGPGQLALTVPVSAETAAGGRIRPGDQIQVLLTTNPGRPEARTVVVVERVTVYDVGHAERLTVVNTGGDSSAPAATEGQISWVTLVVGPEQALTLAEARWSGELDVALLPPR